LGCLTVPSGVMMKWVWIFPSTGLSVPARVCSQQRSISGCFALTVSRRVSGVKGSFSGAEPRAGVAGTTAAVPASGAPGSAGVAGAAVSTTSSEMSMVTPSGGNR